MTCEAMALPFVPFTFPTVTFTHAAEKLGFADVASWSWADKGWSAYSNGRATKKISDSNKGFSQAAKEYLISQGMTDNAAWSWLATADSFSDSWLAWGSYFEDFGAPSLIGGITEAIGGAAGDVVAGLAKGVSGSLLNPWVLGVGGLAIIGGFAYLRRKKA